MCPSEHHTIQETETLRLHNSKAPSHLSSSQLTENVRDWLWGPDPRLCSCWFTVGTGGNHLCSHQLCLHHPRSRLSFYSSLGPKGSCIPEESSSWRNSLKNNYPGSL
jgi:hypothetical protein